MTMSSKSVKPKTQLRFLSTKRFGKCGIARRKGGFSRLLMWWKC